VWVLLFHQKRGDTPSIKIKTNILLIGSKGAGRGCRPTHPLKENRLKEKNTIREFGVPLAAITSGLAPICKLTEPKAEKTEVKAALMMKEK